MSVILHISDPHFGTEQPQVVEALLQLAHAQQPDLTILSGDITQRARHHQFVAARTFMDLLDTPSIVIPGNHDIPLFNIITRFINPYGNLKRMFGNELEPVFRAEDVLVVGVKTTRRYRHKDGEISKEQINRVCELLKTANTEQLRLVVTHQPVFVTEQQDEPNLLHGRMRAIQEWGAAGADLILGGHIHLPFTVPLHEHLSGLSGKLWAVQAGTATSTRIRRNAGNSVNIIRYIAEEGTMRHAMLERWDYDGTLFSFTLRSQQRLDLDRYDVA